MRAGPFSATLLLTLLCWGGFSCPTFAVDPAPPGEGSAPATQSSAWKAKLAPGLLEAARAEGVEVLVLLEQQANVRAATLIPSKRDKGRWVFETLRDLAQRTQSGIRQELDSQGVEYRAFWIVNMLSLRTDATLLQQLAQRQDVFRVIEDPPLQREEWFVEAQPSDARLPEASPANVEWNIARVQAPAVWAEGVTGAGAVVGGMDTGYDWTHPALMRQYRGTKSGSVQHDYNWHDAIHRGPISHCPGDSPEPCDGDLSGHGTHTMGTIVGDDGLGNQIGVAPGARWIGCRCWEEERRTALSYVTECFQWFVAPTNLANTAPDPDRAPHAINNSWICDPGEGCIDPNILLQVVENVRAAGIVVAAGAGNDGPGCSTILYPPAIYAASFSVGATTSADAIASFSSRGPVVVDGSGRLKPDLTAPGANIRSSVPGGSYQGGWNGTSMATPHVTGAVALLVSAVPELAGQVDLLEDILRETVVPLPSGQTCGSFPGSEIPNPIFGHGRLDVYAAYRRALSLQTGIGDPLQPGDTLQAPPHSRLLSGYPNPFNPGTRLDFELSQPSTVSLEVYDVVGRRVRRLLEPQFRQPGSQSIHWDGTDDSGQPLPSGIYVARLTAGRVVSTRQLTLLR